MTGDRDLGESVEEDQILVVSNTSTGFPIPQVFSIIEKAGFTYKLAENLRALNDTLAVIKEPEVLGFNLELRPDLLAPKVEFEQGIETPFKVEMSSVEKGHAALKISVHGEVWGDNLLFSDIKDFVRGTFPGREATFHTAPIIEFEGPIILNRYGRVPENLYDYEKEPSWNRDIERAREQITRRYLKEVLPEIDANLDDVTDEQIEKLTQRIEGADVTITFYSRYRQNPKNRKVNRKEKMSTATYPQLYSYFEIKLDGQGEPLLKFNVLSAYKGRTDCLFSELYFRGTPEEVEQVMERFTALLQKTPVYKKKTESPNT